MLFDGAVKIIVNIVVIITVIISLTYPGYSCRLGLELVFSKQCLL